MSKRHSTVFDFEWSKRITGYEILSSTSLPTKIPTIFTESYELRKLSALPGEDVSYRPFEVKLPIGRRFSELKESTYSSIDEEKALKFACEFGALGVGSGPYSQGESLDMWSDAVPDFKRIYQVLDSDDDEDVKEAIAFGLYNTSSLKLDLRIKLTPETNRKLRFIQFKPQNLLTAMWIMLAQEISTGLEFTHCKNPKCNEWFPARPNQFWCSKKCGKAMSRRNLLSG